MKKIIISLFIIILIAVLAIVAIKTSNAHSEKESADTNEQVIKQEQEETSEEPQEEPEGKPQEEPTEEPIEEPEQKPDSDVNDTEEEEPDSEETVPDNTTTEKTEKQPPAQEHEPEKKETEPKEQEKQLDEAKAARIRELVLPSIVYGTMKQDAGGFKKGEQVEIIRDEGNGARYHVRTDKKEGWVKGGTLSIPADFKTVQDRMNKEDMEYFVNEMNDFNSKTDYFIWIDLSRQLVNVFEGKKGDWSLLHSFMCATGRNATPTVRGIFEVSERGKRFGGYGGAKNWVRFYGPYLMHSVLVDSSGNKIIDNTLGKRASHGCVRMSMEDSKWVYDHIPNGTTVWVN